MTQRLIFLFLSCLSPLFSAFPVTHILICEKWIDLNTDYNEEERRDCIIGTLFPDIRHLKVLRHDLVLEQDTNLEAIREAPTPFVTGMRIHMFVDKMERKLVRKDRIKALLADLPDEDLYSFIKICEDAILYPKGDWERILNYFDTVIAEEKETGVHSTFIYMWHSLIKRYLRQPPEEWINYLSRTHQNFHYASRHTVQLWSEKIPELVQNEELRNFTTDLINEFETLFSPIES